MSEPGGHRSAFFRRLRRVGLAGLIAGLCACDADSEARGDRYPGPFDPCEVTSRPGPPPAGEAALERESAAPYYWRPGPFYAWNTSPLDRCIDDPRSAPAGDEPDVRIYVTYPTLTEPTRSGSADVAPARWPVILFAHANNDTKCTIYRDYWSLHDHWASWGFVVASVDGTEANCKPGGPDNLRQRRDGLLSAAARLRELDEDPDSRFYRRLDLTRVVFAGHSRGGGAALLAAADWGDPAGVIDLQGVDLTAFGFGASPIDGFPVLGFTAGEDVDLDYPLVEPTEDQLASTYTWVNIFGGIHAFTADGVPVEPDDEPFITRKRQHDITEYYSTAFLAHFVGFERSPDAAEGAPDVLFSHMGARVVGDELSALGVQQRWRSAQAQVLVDDFDGVDPTRNALGGANESVALEVSEETWTYRPEAQNPRAMYRKAVSRRLVAGAERGEFTVEVDGGARLSPGGSIQARVKGPDRGRSAEFEVRVRFVDGREAVVDGWDHIGPAPLLNRFTQLVVPAARLGLERAPAALASITFAPRRGELFIDDLRVVE